MSTQNSVKRPSQCDELAELLPAFTVGALTADEVENVKRLLQQCPECLMDLAQYTAIMATFYDRIEPVEPPKYLHDRLMRTLHARKPERKQSLDEPHTFPELLMSTQTDLRDD